MSRLSVTICALVVGVWAVGVSPTVVAGEPAGGQESEEIDDSPSIHEQTGLWGGLLVNGMFGADSPETFQYFDFGLRHKRGEYHIELRAPALALMIDVLYMLTGWFASEVPEPLITRLNPSDPGHWELGHARLGYRFLLVPPGDFELWSGPVETAVGFFGTADLISFANRRDVDQSELNSLGYDDPLVLGAGAFVALGTTREEMQYDVAFGVGRGIRGMENDPEREVTIFMTDLDLQYAPGGRNFAWYLRPRLTGYVTRLSPSVNVGGGLSTGITLGF